MEETVKERWWLLKHLFGKQGNAEELDLNFRGSLEEANEKAKELFNEHFSEETPTIEQDGRIVKGTTGFIKVFGPLPEGNCKPTFIHARYKS